MGKRRSGILVLIAAAAFAGCMPVSTYADPPAAHSEQGSFKVVLAGGRTIYFSTEVQMQVWIAQYTGTAEILYAGPV